ncbi:MAG TPA: polyribonucleotide nucleotidyltransferase [Candidatus Fraserbacteria bacterium]|nr:polyribonucleotide nucleotidyltransferase [Candidatus Fraserbacteria bacterium]
MRNEISYPEVVRLSQGPFTLETGRVARQSDGAVLVSYGDTIVLATVNRADVDEGIDYFPLTVDYEEKFYAGGKIPGGFFKREGKPSDDAVLNARMIDRPIRPLFSPYYRERVHVVLTVLSAEADCRPGLAAMLGASAALTISSIPFQEPIAGVRVGLVDDELIVNPTAEQRAAGRMDIVVAGTAEAVTMVEGTMNEVPEERVTQAIQLAHEQIKALIVFQLEFARQLSPKEKIQTSPPEGIAALRAELQEALGDRLQELYRPMIKLAREALADGMRDKAIEVLLARRSALSDVEQARLKKQLKGLFKELLRAQVRRTTLSEKTRIDGRQSDELRLIHCEVGVLPRVHGSALFTRGETQSLGTCTLGTTRQDEQIIDLMLEDGRKRFMLHYNFKPFCVGESGRMGPPKRREIGHGHLAENAIKPVLPSQEEFPYSIRLVSEILESNGSSSMATVCSSSMALMDAGVPISSAVAGIAMGLVEEEGEYLILTDIAGYEDSFGDMDFKVAGTRQGLTAFQLDVKSGGLSGQVMSEAMAQAHRARMAILDRMEQTIARPREQLSKYAPILEIIMINPEKIGAVIGPGGKMIRKLQTETETAIDIEEDGAVKISGPNAQAVAEARARIEELTEEVEIGRRYHGKVTRIERFGAFVEIKDGTQGLIRLPNLSDHYVKKVEDVVSLGDELETEVIEIDEMGRINLKRLSGGGQGEEKPAIAIGARFPGKVKSTTDYGAFVDFNQGESGLIHISVLSDHYVKRVEDVVKVGDPVTVEVIKVDEKGRYGLKLVEGGTGAAGPAESD